MIDPLRASRRTFLSQTSFGLGGAALASLMASQTSGADSAKGGVNAGHSSANQPGRSDTPHHQPKVKRVIFLCMAGGPSHLETFDYKPELEKLDGKPMPTSYTEGQPIAQLQGKALTCQGPLTKFGQYGKSGQTISDYLPWHQNCLLYTSPSPRDQRGSRMPSSA